MNKTFTFYFTSFSSFLVVGGGARTINDAKLVCFNMTSLPLPVYVAYLIVLRVQQMIVLCGCNLVFKK
jgi:hypothetical protein